VTLEVISASLADVESQVSVTEADLKAAYADRKDQFQQPERRRIRHVLVETEAAVKDVLAKLSPGLISPRWLSNCPRIRAQPLQAVISESRRAMRL
jgi:hypothetical protein